MVWHTSNGRRAAIPQTILRSFTRQFNPYLCIAQLSRLGHLYVMYVPDPEVYVGRVKAEGERIIKNSSLGPRLILYKSL